MADEIKDEPQAPKRFVSALKKETVELEDDGGAIKQYILHELTGKQRDDYFNYMSDKVRPDGSVKNFTGATSFLLMLSMTDTSGRRLSPEFVDKLSTTCATELFQIAQKLSGLDVKAEKEAKND